MKDIEEAFAKALNEKLKQDPWYDWRHAQEPEYAPATEGARKQRDWRINRA